MMNELNNPEKQNIKLCVDEIYINFIRQRDEVLLVTFHNMGDVALRRVDQSKPGWGGKFVLEQGYSCLFIEPTRNNWYRSEKLFTYFDSLKGAGFFDQFKKIVFAGGSMGGYGALAFSSLAPGSIVIAINPQVSLASDIVPWETRFSEGRSQNWTGRYRDGSREILNADRVYVVYDPFHKLDALHASLLRSPNVEFFKIPFVGHRMPVWMQEMGILKDFMKSAVNGDLTSDKFTDFAKKRRNICRYYQTLYNVLLSRKKLNSASLVAQRAKDRGFLVTADAPNSYDIKVPNKLAKRQHSNVRPNQKNIFNNQTRISKGRSLITLNTMQIVAQIKAEHPDFLDVLNDNKAARLLRLALMQIAKNVASIEKGVVRVPCFGNFHVIQTGFEKNDEKNASRKVIFSTNKPKKREGS